MNRENEISSVETLAEIRSMMERSSRVLSLSGWSGIWAGIVALAGGIIAKVWIHAFYQQDNILFSDVYTGRAIRLAERLFLLALVVFVTALSGGIYFTYRKNKKSQDTLWNAASKRLMINLLLPIFAGGVFCFVFATNLDGQYIAATSLAFYGLALVNGSKYTLTDIRYLGIAEIILGLICLFYPGWGIYFWMLGFGILHILYGVIMWRKYDRK